LSSIEVATHAVAFATQAAIDCTTIFSEHAGRFDIAKAAFVGLKISPPSFASAARLEIGHQILSKNLCSFLSAPGKREKA
jgi:hypothetical protein